MRKLKLFEELWLLELNKLIDANLDSSRFTTEELAFQMCLSSATLYRKVKKIVGLPPTDYIRQRKLDKTLDLFHSPTAYSMEELATRAGYSRKDHFAKIFEENRNYASDR